MNILAKQGEGGTPYSYRKASAGRIFAAELLGYKVASSETISDTAATNTPSSSRGANGR